MPRAPKNDYDVQEIQLYAVNTYELLPEREQIEREAAALIRSGKIPGYIKYRATLQYRSWLRRAAQQYRREMPENCPKFNINSINAAAEEMYDDFLTEFTIRPDDYR